MRYRYSYVEFTRHLPIDGPVKKLVNSVANVEGSEDGRGISLPGGVLVPWAMVACRIGERIVDEPASATETPNPQPPPPAKRRNR
jgi:hypothetical protein